MKPRLLAIQKTRPIEYRAKVLGQALLATRTDANSFWMMLSGNAEVAFPPRTTPTITAAAANLTTPAAPAATFTANVAPAAASTTGSLPPAAMVVATSAAIPSTISDAFAVAADVATPSTGGQKRKA